MERMHGHNGKVLYGRPPWMFSRNERIPANITSRRQGNGTDTFDIEVMELRIVIVLVS